MIRRKIVAITKRGGRTRRGNPKTYWIVLECGHVIYDTFSARTTIQEFMLTQNILANRRCRQCEANKPVDLEMLKAFTPYKVWNEQNFSRFEEEQKT